MGKENQGYPQLRRSVFREAEDLIRPDDFDGALCRDESVDPDWWHPVNEDGVHTNPDTELAKQICRAGDGGAPCPWVAECDLYARATKQLHGIWGGLEPFERGVVYRKGKYQFRKGMDEGEDVA